ncbi:MAG: right-handed parallel beta-helix repeat-containing protein [Deltaproteobacteria bacterium]|nr:right-handed parallel beta-helix repeat-containing protein [Nannocystaceae bacterium]
MRFTCLERVGIERAPGAASSLTRAGAGVLGLLVSAACSVDTTSNDDGPQLVPHCEDLNGDFTCQTAHPGAPFCSRCVPKEMDQGCVAAAPAPACQIDGGSDTEPTVSTTMREDSSSGDTSTGETGSSTSPADTTADSSSSSTTSEPYVCNEEGQLDEDCEALDPARPYCFESSCVGCTAAEGDAFCGTFDAQVPFCNAETDRCESCANAGADFCGGTSPICTADGACSPCTDHAECPDSACHIASDDPLVGECFDNSNVIWVDRSAICPGLGTELSPSCSLAQALVGITPGESWVVHAQGGTPYDEHVIADGVTVAILGSGVPQLTGEPGLNDASLSIVSGTVYLQGVRVRDNLQSHGIACGGGTLWMDQSEVRGNDEYGIYLTSPCEITVRRAGVHSNAGGGIRQFGGTLVLDNAVVARNGDGSRGPAINAQFSDVQILYSTIAGNDGVGNDSLQCLTATGTVRNSIVQGMDTGSVDLDCFVLDFSTNAIDTPSFVGADGVAVDAYDPQWFADPEEGDFRIVNAPFTQFGEVAVWQDGDPPLDADGTVRPVGGELGFAGVDEP